MTLDEIALKCETDKSSRVHGYTSAYAHILANRNIKRILEIGIAKGASLNMWREYFPAAKVYGIDINPKRARGSKDCFVADQGSVEDLQKVIMQIGGNFDLIVDDGSHDLSHQITSLRTLFPYLSFSGIYAIEDVKYPLRFIEKDFIDTNIKSQLPIKYRMIASKEPNEFLITYEYYESL